MPPIAVPDVIAGVIVAVTFVIGLVVAYRQGFHAALPVRNEPFDFLPTDLSLHNSSWRLTGNAEPGRPESAAWSATLHWQQSGSRIIGEGRNSTGRRWSVEGIVHHRQVVCLTHRLDTESTGPVLLMLCADAAGDRLTGYRIQRDRQGTWLNLDEISAEQEWETQTPAVPISDRERTPAERS